MMKRTISNIKAREILDSRGFPTVEVDVILDDGSMGRASVPSGASTGKFEALEKRDHDERRYQGKGVLTVVDSINSEIHPHLQGLDASNQEKIDKKLIDLDGTEKKEKLGSNAILPVSLACAKAAAASYKMPLYRYLGGTSAKTLPIPLINILNGGVHANNGLSVQEFMIVPIGADSFTQALEYSSKVFFSLITILKSKGMSTAVGDEGGVAPPVSTTREALNLILEAITAAKLTPGKEIALALDVAASEFYNARDNVYEIDGEKKSPAALLMYYENLVNVYPIVSLEDPFDQEDFAHYSSLTSLIGNRCQIVGDDIFVTNISRLDQGIKEKAANAILIKLNQIGTLSETLNVIDHAKRNGFNTVISHRSGETEDTTMSDLAIATNAGQIKTGSLCRSERTAKYNQLLRIQEELGKSGTFFNPFLKK
jgi:enolase